MLNIKNQSMNILYIHKTNLYKNYCIHEHASIIESEKLLKEVSSSSLIFP